MKDISYVEFAEAFEACMTVPVVRCPWGCSEFVGKAKECIPLDCVVQFFVERKLSCYSDSNMLKKVDGMGFRKDWFCSPPVVCGRRCCPSMIVRKRRAPMFLCCRYHNMRHTLSYVHVPRNPTGSMAFVADNAKAPIVAVPRTIGTFKKGKSNNSYGVRRICGNFRGIDSMNLSIVQTPMMGNVVSQRRHLLYLCGRSEQGPSHGAVSVCRVSIPMM